MEEELSRYHIQIAAQSEKRLANEGQLTKVKAGYIFFFFTGMAAVRGSIVKLANVLQSKLIKSTSLYAS